MKGGYSAEVAVNRLTEPQWLSVPIKVFDNEIVYSAYERVGDKLRNGMVPHTSTDMQAERVSEGDKL